MDIVNLFNTIFWNTAQQMALLIMPIISIIVIIKAIHFFIIKGTD